MYSKKSLFSLLALLALTTALAGCTSPSATPHVATATPSPAASVAPTAAASATPMATPTVSPTATPAASPAPATAAVTIRDFTFTPSVVHIAAGGSVTWTNQDGTAHTVKFSNSESSALGNGATYTKKFDTPGKYDYNCGIHPSMTGTVEVS
jgi:plastocyanin